MRDRKYNYSLLMFFSISVILIIVAMLWPNESKEELLFILLTNLLIGYCFLEVFIEYKRNQWRALITPPVLASVIFFGLSFGVSNYSILSAPFAIPYFGTVNEFVFGYLNQAMFCALLGSFAMWRGYRAIVSKRLGVRSRSYLQNRGFIRSDFKVNVTILLFFIVISISSRLVQASLGILGYSAEYSQLFLLAEYKQLLDIGAGFGALALMGLALNHYSRESRKSVLLEVLFVTVFLLEIFFGFVSGFKGQVVLPLIIVGLCYYIVHHKIPRTMIVMFLILLILAYQVIEPFRHARNTGVKFDNRSIGDITMLLSESLFYEGVSKSNDYYADQVISRLNLTMFAAASIAYNDRIGITDDDPKFAERILMAPVYAYIPRLIWASKPVSSLGIWFNIKVLGAANTNETSTGMSSIGYLYFAGGTFAVLIGFFIVGIVQRYIYETFAKASGGGWLVYLGLLLPLATIDSDLGSVATTLFRFGPIMLIGQYLLFRKPRVKNKFVEMQTSFYR